MNLRSVTFNLLASAGLLSADQAQAWHFTDLAKALDRAPATEKLNALEPLFLELGKVASRNGCTLSDSALNSVVPSLLEALKDSNGTVRLQAVTSLAFACVRESNWDTAVKDSLLQVARNDGDISVRNSAEFWARNLDKPSDQRARPAGA